MKAILPAAGYATRLYPLTKNKPKALMPVAGTPVIDYILSALCAVPTVDEIIVVSNSTFYSQFIVWKQSAVRAVPIRVLDNGVSKLEECRGTLGDIAYALEQCTVGEDIIIINADNLFSFDLRPAYLSFKERGDSIGIRRMENRALAAQLGAVGIDTTGRVNGFEEKKPSSALSYSSLGIYFFRRETLHFFFRYLNEGQAPDCFGDFITWLYPQTALYGFSFDVQGFWFDIGTPDSYAEAQETVAAWCGVPERFF